MNCSEFNDFKQSPIPTRTNTGARRVTLKLMIAGARVEELLPPMGEKQT